MRWYGQVVVASLLAGGAWLTVQNWAVIQPHVPEPVLKVITPLLPAPATPPPGPQAGGAPRPGGPGGQAPVVEVLPVATGVITEITEAVGNTRAFESVVINAKVSGIVEAVSFTEGANVTAGQELIRIESAERRADLEAAKAAIQQEEAKRNELRTKLDRAVQLRRSGAGTEALVDDLAAQIKTSDSAIQNALARERASQARMNDVVIRAPFAGRVGIRQISVGTFLDTRTNITTLDDISKVRLDFQVPENLMARVKADAMVTATSTAFGNRKFSGRVTVIDTRIDPTTRSVKLTAIVENPDQTLRPGMFMNAFLEVARRENAMLIPEEAILGEGPLQIVFAVKDNRVERRVIKVGQREDGKVEVLEGLALGEQVVVRGLQRVRGGMMVTARPFGQQSPAGAPPAAAGAPSAGNAPAGLPAGSPAAAPQARPQPQAQGPVPVVPGQPQTARP